MAFGLTRRRFVGLGAAAFFGTAATARAAGLPLPAVIDAAVDTRRALPALAAAGVRVIVRYYASARQDFLPEKRLTAGEADAVRAAGLALGACYQYYNNRFDSMTAVRGKADAAYSLAHARDEIRQPPGSAIYFGVDGDWPKRAEMDAVLRYFSAVAETMAAAGSPYRVGVYGSGRTCAELAGRALASLFWLARSTGWTGTAEFYNGGGWTLYQTMHEVARGGIRLDSNVLNPTAVDQGFFDAGGPVTALSDKAALAARRFVGKAGAELLAGPDGPAVGRLKPRAVVAVVEQRGDVVAMDVDDSGRVAGWCRAAELGFMDRMP